MPRVIFKLDQELLSVEEITPWKNILRTRLPLPGKPPFDTPASRPAEKKLWRPWRPSALGFESWPRSEEEIGYPLRVTIPKWVGFQIGGLH